MIEAFAVSAIAPECVLVSCVLGMQYNIQLNY